MQFAGTNLQPKTGYLRHCAAMAAVVPAATVAVIVAARNYARFLAECLTSIQKQEGGIPIELVYVDDGSDDNSIQVARALGVRAIRLTHGGVVRARNQGLAVTTAPFVVHVDGDDILPSDYIASCLRALKANPQAPLACTHAQAFGDHHSFWRVREWDRNNLFKRNWINTSAMYRRQIIEDAGGWIDCGTAWDWHLALRASRFGDPVTADTHLLYRIHSQSFSALNGERGEHDSFAPVFGRIRRECSRVAVCALVSGRLPKLASTWLHRLARCVDHAYAPPDLILLDNATHRRDGWLWDGAEGWAYAFNSVQIRRWPAEQAFPRDMAHERARLLASAYNAMCEATDAEILWFVEDDILPPVNAFSKMSRLLTEGLFDCRAAVGGWYRNRHEPDHWLAHRLPDGYDVHQAVPIREVQAEPFDVDLTGTGCLMVFRPVAGWHPFESHVLGVPAHDWAWCHAVRQRGGRITLHPQVQCRHYQTEEVYV